MKLELEQVRHVAKLARLSLSEEEEHRFSTQLSAILDAVDSLAAVNTEGVPVTTLATFTTPREDVVREELPVDVALKNAPQKQGHSFAIPRVIE